MYLRLGNLSVAQFAARVGADFTSEEIESLEAHRTDTASFTDPEKFHIFEDPSISVVIGSAALDTALPIFQAANTRHPFNTKVQFYPTNEKSN